MSVLGHRLRAYVRPSASFDPLSISGMQFWIDSDDASTFTYSSGVLVSQWNDKSGNARHVSQATTTKQPSRNTTRNSKNTVAFAVGRADELVSANVTMAQPMTIFIVARYSNVDANNHTALAPRVYFGTYAEYYLYAGVGGHGTGSDDALWHYFTCIANGASSSIAVDNGSPITGNPGANGWATHPIRVGADNGATGWDGDIAEILIYNTSLGSTDLANVKSYLASKWGF